MIRHHLLFYVDGKSMRVRTDINVFRCTNACSIHRINTLLRRVCVSCRCCTECRRNINGSEYISILLLSLRYQTPTFLYRYLLLQHNWSHWQAQFISDKWLEKSENYCNVWYRRGGRGLLPTLWRVHCFVQQLHMSTVSLDRRTLQEEMHVVKYAEI